VTHAVVLDPVRDELFTAIKGKGAQQNGASIRTSMCVRLEDALIGTVFPARANAKLPAYLPVFAAVLRQCAGVRRAGAGALDLAYVAAGRLDGFWVMSQKAWDVAAGALIVNEAGGRVGDFAGGKERIRHHVFGNDLDSDVRALNPGLARGTLRVAPQRGGFSRNEIVALPEAPADLDPAAGILTQGEGNMLSHVQLLARALGIPNVVLGPEAYAKLKPHDGQQVFFIATPGGRVIIKEVAAMNATDRAVYDEFTRNETRADDGSLVAGGARLHIDRSKVDLSKTMPIDLTQVRRSDSG
jgi:hypothetical protein